MKLERIQQRATKLILKTTDEYQKRREKLNLLSLGILGLSSCLSLTLIQLVFSVEERQGSDTVSQTPGDTLTEYKDVFEGLGSFPGVHKIQLRREVNPVNHPPRKVPIALRKKTWKKSWREWRV